MNIEIKNCNNIDSANIVLTENKLNNVLEKSKTISPDFKIKMHNTKIYKEDDSV
jgi:hypothetical protein